jgi:hypothetical protein
VPLHDGSAGDVIAALERSGVIAAAVTSRQPTLDDVYLRVTVDHLDAAAAAIITLAARRAALTSRTPRQIAVPLLGPLLLALIAGPALKAATGGLRSHIDYASFIDIGTIGLLVPLSCIFAGLSVIIDREEGAQRELLSAPVPRA